MSKETYCGGEIIFTSKKDTLFHAFDGDLQFIAEGKNQWQGETDTLIGNYVPTAVGEENKIFIACIDFYRSSDNSDGKYGAKDKGYNGEFGFDRFDSDVVAGGLASKYERLSSIIPDKKTYDGKKVYLCPYLSIWPPNVEGNKDNKKSKVTLYVKANKANTKSAKDTAQIEFISSDPSIITVSTNTELEIGGDAKSIIVVCKGSFDKDVEIIAKAKDESQELGKLVIKANTIYKTILQPVKVTFSSTSSTEAKDIPHVDVMTNIAKTFNENSFNQAYIYGELAATTKHVTFLESEFREYFNNIDGKKYLKYSDQKLALKYNELMGRRYEANNSGKADQQRREERLKNKIDLLLKEFDKMYDYKNAALKKAKEMHQEKSVTNIWNNLKIKALYEDFEKEKKEYNNKYPNPFKLDQEGKIYFFYTEDIQGAGSPEKEVQAFSLTEEGTAQIFNSALTDRDAVSLVIHELGHAFGLRHPFDDKVMGKYQIKEDGTKYKQDYDDEISTIEFEIDKTIKPSIDDQERLEKMSKKENTPLQELQGLTFVDKRYSQLQYMIKQQYTFDDFQKRFVGLIESNSGILKLEITRLAEIESDRASLSQENENLKNKKNELDRLKEQRKKAKSYEELPNYKSNSDTLENYLDYRQKTDSTFNPNFQYKSFYQWQWRKMIELGTEKKYIKKIN